MTFRYDVIYPTVQLSLMVPTEIHATSSALSSQGVQIANQHPYLILQGQKLLNGKEVQAQLEGLPYAKPVTPASNSVSTTTLWIVVGLLVMFAILGVTWFLYRSRSRQAPAKRGNAGSASNGKAAKTTADSNPNKRRENRKSQRLSWRQNQWRQRPRAAAGAPARTIGTGQTLRVRQAVQNRISGETSQNQSPTTRPHERTGGAMAL